MQIHACFLKVITLTDPPDTTPVPSDSECRRKRVFVNFFHHFLRSGPETTTLLDGGLALNLSVWPSIWGHEHFEQKTETFRIISGLVKVLWSGKIQVRKHHVLCGSNTILSQHEKYPFTPEAQKLQQPYPKWYLRSSGHWFLWHSGERSESGNVHRPAPERLQCFRTYWSTLKDSFNSLILVLLTAAGLITTTATTSEQIVLNLGNTITSTSTMVTTTETTMATTTMTGTATVTSTGGDGPISTTPAGPGTNPPVVRGTYTSGTITNVSLPCVRSESWKPVDNDSSDS